MSPRAKKICSGTTFGAFESLHVFWLLKNCKIRRGGRSIEKNSGNYVVSLKYRSQAEASQHMLTRNTDQTSRFLRKVFEKTKILKVVRYHHDTSRITKATVNQAFLRGGQLRPVYFSLNYNFFANVNEMTRIVLNLVSRDFPQISSSSFLYAFLGVIMSPKQSKSR